MKSVKCLVKRPEMEVNAVNINGLTALDIIQHMPSDMKGMEIREHLVKAGALSSRNMLAFMRERGTTMVIENPQFIPPPVPPPPTIVLAEAKAETPLRDSRSKIREIKKKDWTKKKREALMIAATLIVGMTFQVAVNPLGGVWDEDKVDGDGEDNKKMLAGTSIMAHYYPEHYEMYMVYNLVSFGSLCMVLLGVSGVTFREVPFAKRRILMWV